MKHTLSSIEKRLNALELRIVPPDEAPVRIQDVKHYLQMTREELNQMMEERLQDPKSYFDVRSHDRINELLDLAQTRRIADLTSI